MAPIVREKKAEKGLLGRGITFVCRYHKHWRHPARVAALSHAVAVWWESQPQLHPLTVRRTCPWTLIGYPGVNANLAQFLQLYLPIIREREQWAGRIQLSHRGAMKHPAASTLPWQPSPISMVQIRCTSTLGTTNTLRSQEPAWHSSVQQGKEKNTKRSVPKGTFSTLNFS